MKRILLSSALCLIALHGANGQSNPAWVTRQVPTAAQWNSTFAGKMDWNGGALAGVSMALTGAFSAGGSGSFGTITGGAVYNSLYAVTGVERKTRYYTGSVLALDAGLNTANNYVIGLYSGGVFSFNPLTITASNGDLTLRGTGGTINATVTQGGSGAAQLSYLDIASGAAGLGPKLTATASSETNVNIRLVPKGTGVVTSSTGFSANSGTITLSGSTDNVKPIRADANLAGTESGLPVGIDTRGSHIYATVSSDTAKYPDGVLNVVMVANNLASGWNGGRRAYGYQTNTTASTTLGNSTDGFVGVGGQVYGNHNLGGVTTGFGTTQMGMGAIFGANPRVKLGAGGTFYNGVVGTEIGAEMLAGSSASYFAVLQLVLEQSHGAHGVTRDSMLMFGGQAGITAGAREIMLIGSGAGEWPGDPNGYILQTRHGNAADAFSAGGIDFNPVTFNGSGATGGGFAFRSDGFRILQTGAMQVGYGKIDGSTGGLKLTAPYSILSGTPTVSAGGTGWSVGELAADVYGNIVQVATLSGSAVATVTVVRRGWTDSVPGGAVAFTSVNSVSGTKGTGLTLTTAWSAVDDITIGASGDGIGFYGATPVSKQTGVAVTSAGIHAALVNLGLIAP